MRPHLRWEIKRELRVFNHAKETGNISKTCRFIDISRQSFYVRKRAFDKFREQGLAPKKHGVSPEKSPLKTPPEIMDVKFLIFPQPDGSKAKRFQYTAIDDATRIRALKIYEKHT